MKTTVAWLVTLRAGPGHYGLTCFQHWAFDPVQRAKRASGAGTGLEAYPTVRTCGETGSCQITRAGSARLASISTLPRMVGVTPVLRGEATANWAVADIGR